MTIVSFSSLSGVSITVGPSFADNADGTFTVTWTTSIAADSRINYGATSGYGSTSYAASLVTSHSITVDGNVGDTHYEAVSVADGNTVTSADDTGTIAGILLTDKDATWDHVSSVNGVLQLADNITSWDAYLDNSSDATCVAFVARAMTANPGYIGLNSSGVVVIDVPVLANGGININACQIPAAKLDVSSLVTVTAQHMYNVGNLLLTAQPSTPLITTLDRALEWANCYNMTGAASLPELVNCHASLSFAYTNITSLNLPKLVNMTYVDTKGGIWCGGDFATVGGSGKSQLASLSTMLLADLTACAIRVEETHATSGFTTWNYDTGVWLTLGNHFNITLTRTSIVQAFCNALLIHLNNIANVTESYYTDTGTGADYLYNTVDLRYGNGGATESGLSGAATTAIAALRALNIVVQMDA